MNDRIKHTPRKQAILLEITDAVDGCPADDDRAEKVMDYFGYTSDIQRGPDPGLYWIEKAAASALADDGFIEEVAMTDDGDYGVVEVRRQDNDDGPGEARS